MVRAGRVRVIVAMWGALWATRARAEAPAPPLAWTAPAAAPLALGRPALEPPPPLVERSLAALSVDLAVPGLAQDELIGNCGPTAAAMLVGAYAGAAGGDELTHLRDRAGRYSWEAYPIRRLRLPGHDPGLTTAPMLEATIHDLTRDVQVTATSHPWIPREAWSLATLKRALVDGRPVLALVQASILWGVRTPGLHWVVVRGLERGAVAYNDPADATRSEAPLGRFWLAWRLAELYRSLYAGGGFQALVPDRPLPALSLHEDAARPDLPVAR